MLLCARLTAIFVLEEGEGRREGTLTFLTPGQAQQVNGESVSSARSRARTKQAESAWEAGAARGQYQRNGNRRGKNVFAQRAQDGDCVNKLKKVSQKLELTFLRLSVFVLLVAVFFFA